MAKCEFCGKDVKFGIKVSHSHRRSNRTRNILLLCIFKSRPSGGSFAFRCEIRQAVRSLPY